MKISTLFLFFCKQFIYLTSLFEYNCFTWCVSFCFVTKWISYTYTYIPISPPSCVSLPPSLSQPSRWSQSNELISLCYAACKQVLSVWKVGSFKQWPNPGGIRIPWRTKFKKVSKTPKHTDSWVLSVLPSENLYFYKAPRYYQWSDLEFPGLQSVKSFFLLPTCAPTYFPDKSRLSGHTFWSAVPKRCLLVGGSFRPHSMKILLRRRLSSPVFPVQLHN